jgi:protocatechuate 3,4-dioxygenase beta subunit
VALLVGALFFVLSGERGGGRGNGVSDSRAANAPELEAPAVEVAVSAVPSASAVAPERVAAEVAHEALPTSVTRAELAGLTGRVLEHDGRPVARIRVALLEFHATLLFDATGLDEEEPALELAETVTDDAGRFVLGGARASAFQALGVDLAGPRATVRVIDRSLVNRERTDVGDVVLAPYGVLSGRVVDENGAPVAGARVRAGPFPAEILQAQLQEFRPDSLVSVNRSLLGGEGLEIVDAPDWIRRAIERFPVPTTTSAADGSFRIEGVALSQVVGGADKAGLVGVGFGPFDLTGGAHDAGTLVLERGRTVRGVVEDGSGDPVSGVEVVAGAELFPGVAFLQPCGTSDEDGGFVLTGVPASGQVVAAARRSRHEPWSTATSSRPDGLLIEMEDQVQLTVLVRDEAGAPVAGADLRLAPERQREKRGFFEPLAFLPRPPSPRGTFLEVEPGRYVNARVSAGRYEVQARVPGRAPGFAEADCRAGAAEVVLLSPAGHALELTVLDAATGEPIVGARASVLRAASSGLVKLAARSTDGGGRATLGPLTAVRAEPDAPEFFPSETVLLVQHPRYGEHSNAFDPAQASLTIELRSGGVLAGRVHWGGAEPTRLYMLAAALQRDEDGFIEMFSLPRLTVTDLAGAFRVTNLTPGQYRVSLTERFLHQDPLGLMTDEFDPLELYEGAVEIRDGETTELEIDLSPTGRGTTARVVGHVRFDGRDLEGAEVTVNANERVRVLTDARGRFETPSFAVRGSTYVRIEGNVAPLGEDPREMQLYSESVELAQDDVHEIELDLHPLKLSVRVLEAGSDEPLSGAFVSIPRRGEQSFGHEGAQTGSSGEAQVLLLAAGDYTVSARADGFGPASNAVKVPEGGLAEPVVLRLARSVPCAGHVLPDAATAAAPGRGFAYLVVQAEDGTHREGTMLRAPEYAFSIEGLGPGRYKAQIYLNGDQGEEVTFELGPGGDVNLSFAFVPRSE